MTVVEDGTRRRCRQKCETELRQGRPQNTGFWDEDRKLPTTLVLTDEYLNTKPGTAAALLALRKVVRSLSR